MANNRQTAMEVAHRRYTRAEMMERELHQTLAVWRAHRLIGQWRLRRGSNGDVLIMDLGVPFQTFTLSYSITEHELEMGGLEALHFWLNTIERELREHYEHWRCSRRTMSAPPGRMEIHGVDLAIGPDEELFSQRHIELLRQMAMQAFDAGFADAIQRPEAEKKAKELFIATAGKAAYATLESGAPWPITGSQGTPYLLYKRASYCIERPGDGARLCAVVPGVPLWDHLLGIKLMVENDEPTFLKTANVSGGVHIHGRYLQPEQFWFDEYAEREIARERHR